MNFRPIIIVAGEPNSVFFEIFCKSVQNNKFKSPIILIGSKRLLDLQIKSLNKKITINTLDFKKIKKNSIFKKKLTLLILNMINQKLLIRFHLNQMHILKNVLNWD